MGNHASHNEGKPSVFKVEKNIIDGDKTVVCGSATVEFVCSDGEHRFSKAPRESIMLLQGLGVEGDAHMGTTVQHLSRIKRDPTTPNLRQVHIMHAELHDELNAKGFNIHGGDMGENILTRGIDVLALRLNTELRFEGSGAVVRVTGLRNPCMQIDKFREGLRSACLDQDASGELVRKAGIMGVVVQGGTVRPGDVIRIHVPEGATDALGVV
jgi:MOSC domain-containing protein YiiM